MQVYVNKLLFKIKKFLFFDDYLKYVDWVQMLLTEITVLV